MYQPGAKKPRHCGGGAECSIFNYAFDARRFFLTLKYANAPAMIGQAIRMVIMTGSDTFVKKGMLSPRLSMKIIPVDPIKTPSALIAAIANGLFLNVFIIVSPSFNYACMSLFALK